MKKAIPILLLISLIVLNLISSDRITQALLFSLVLLMLISICLNFAIRKKISAKLYISASGRVDKSAAGILEIINESLMPILALNIKLRVDNLYTGDTEVKTFAVSMGSKGKKSIPIEVHNKHCGKISCYIEKISISDFFQIFDIDCKARAKSNFTILPEIFDIEVTYDLRESDDFDNDVYSPYKKGRDLSETYQIREYEQGDNLRQIHWKLSSKIDKLIVRDPSLPLDKELMVVVDKSLRAEANSQQKDALAELAISTCQSLIDSELGFVLVWNTPQENTIETQNMQFDEDIIEVISKIIGTEPYVSETSCADGYLSLYGKSKATHVIYLSIGNTKSVDELSDSKLLHIDASDADYRENNHELILY